MRNGMAIFTGIGLIATAGTAQAASPEYCALFAREYANQAVATSGSTAPPDPRVQDRAFYKCLNLDEEPELPRKSAYFGTDLDSETPIEQGSAEDAGGPAAEPSAATATAQATPARRSGRRRGSGLDPWTPEWRAWCESHFPNSFDPETGTVLPYSGSRRFCD
jgi:hypothetical protein